MMRRGPGRMSGAALLLVLWLIVLMTGLVGSFALLSRVEGLQGRALTRGLVAENAARAGIEYALTRVALADPRRQWRADGRPYRWRFADADVEVRLIDEGGKLDLNRAEVPLLGALLRAVGVEPGQAERLAAVIVDWRDTDQLSQPAGGGEDRDYANAGLPYGAKDAEFESIAELQQVLGFTPAIYARIEPHVTVFSGRARPDPAFASAEVLDALGMNGQDVVARRQRQDPASAAAAPGPDDGLIGAGGSGTYSIDSRAQLADGRVAVLRVVVRAGGSAIPGTAYTALRWEEGAPR